MFSFFQSKKRQLSFSDIGENENQNPTNENVKNVRSVKAKVSEKEEIKPIPLMPLTNAIQGSRPQDERFLSSRISAVEVKKQPVRSASLPIVPIELLKQEIVKPVLDKPTEFQRMDSMYDKDYMLNLALTGEDENEVVEAEEDEIQIMFSKVRHNRLEYVRDALVKKGFNPSSRDEFGNTMLHVCAMNNLRKMAGIIISAGCDVNCTNFKGLTPLDYSLRYQFDELSTWLQEKHQAKRSKPTADEVDQRFASVTRSRSMR